MSISETEGGKMSIRSESQIGIDTDQHISEEMADVLKKYEHKLDMIKSVKATLMTNSDIVISIPNLTEAMDRLNEYISRIQKTPPETKDHLIKNVLKLSSALRSLAVMIENAELLDETAIKEPTLREMEDLTLLQKSKSIYHSSCMYLNSLNSFGIMENMVIDLENRIEDFSFIISQNGSDHYRDHTIQEEQEKLIEGALNHLSNNIDQLIEGVKYTYPKFYNEYQSSRIMREGPVGEDNWLY